MEGWNPIELPSFEDMHKNHNPLPRPMCNVCMTTINIRKLHANIFEESSKTVDSVSITHQG